MRILYFSNDYTTHDRRFLLKMLDGGHEVFFLRLQGGGRTYEQRDLPGVTSLGNLGLRGPATPELCLGAIPDLVRVIDRIRPDLVHAGPMPSCAFMVALAGFHPLASMSWGSDILIDAKEHELVGWAAHHAATHSDLLVVDCDAVRHALQSGCALPDERFIQFPWGLDLARFPRRTVVAPQDEIVVLSTRSWEAIYDVETAVRAFAIAQRAEPRLKLVLVGDGSRAASVAEAISRSNIAHAIECPGRLDELAVGRAFASAHVYLSCSLSDGTSVSLLEAMANGLPVVVTDAPGNREWVDTAGGGWLAPPSDPEGFARALLAAAQLEVSERQRCATMNRSRVERDADWHANGRRLLDAYERIAAPAATALRPTTSPSETT